MKLIKVISVQTLLIIMTGTLIGIVLLFSAFCFFQSNTLLNRVQTLSRVTVPSLWSMTLVDMMHDGIRANVLNSILLGVGHSPSTAIEIETEGKEFKTLAEEHLNKLQNLDLSAGIRTKIHKATTEFEAYIAQAQVVRNHALGGRLKNAKIELDPFMKQFEDLEKDLGVLGEEIQSSALIIQKETDEGAQQSIMRLLTLSLLSIGSGIIASYIIIRRAMGIISEASTKIFAEAANVGTGAVIVDSSANELAANMKAQASSLQNSAATVHEISEMARLSADNATDVRQAATLAVDVAASGKSRVKDLVLAFTGLNEVMANIQNQVTETNTQFSEVAKVIQEIGSKTQMINEIVFQTKLLSFNASVEAARAGEHGKGFAVVAEEVGNLARSSGVAAEEISKILTFNRQKVDETVEAARKKMAAVMDEFVAKLESSRNLAADCDATLDKVVNVSQQVQSKIDQISGAIREQSSGVAEMSKTLEQIGASVSNSNQAATSSASTATELLAASVSLNLSIEEMVQKLGSQLPSILKQKPDALANIQKSPQEDHEILNVTKNAA